jgi:hypothetical protein
METSPPGTARHAQLEPSVIRIAHRHIQSSGEAQFDGVSIHETYWLSWRWAQWAAGAFRRANPELQESVAQAWRLADPGMAAAESSTCEVFDPARAGEGGLNLRLMAILHALTVARNVLSAVSEKQNTPGAATPPVWLPGSAGLFSVLRQLASEPLTPHELAVRRADTATTPLAHGGLCTVPDLAVNALILADTDEFMRLEPTARARWIAEAAEHGEGVAPPQR